MCVLEVEVLSTTLLPPIPIAESSFEGLVDAQK